MESRIALRESFISSLDYSRAVALHHYAADSVKSREAVSARSAHSVTQLARMFS